MLLVSAVQELGTREGSRTNLLISAPKGPTAIFVTHRGTLVLALRWWVVYSHPELAASASAASFNSVMSCFANRLLFRLAGVQLGANHPMKQTTQESLLSSSKFWAGLAAVCGPPSTTSPNFHPENLAKPIHSRLDDVTQV